MSYRRAVFLDIQGTLGGEGLGDIRDFAFFPFAGSAIKLLNESNLLAVVVTNQSHISKGEFTYDEFLKRMDSLKEELALQGARLDAVYCCPHTTADGCTCHKPLPGMLRQAEKEWGLDLSECYVVGDAGAWDIVMARSVACKAVLVRTGLGESSLGEYRDLWAGIEADFIAENVLDAARWIAERESRDSREPV